MLGYGPESRARGIRASAKAGDEGINHSQGHLQKRAGASSVLYMLARTTARAEKCHGKSSTLALEAVESVAGWHFVRGAAFHRYRISSNVEKVEGFECMCVAK